jgi:FMNH2-dependent dimethyl sulfone monooxygenase
MGSIGLRGRSVKITRGPFDPGGQPRIETPNRLVLGLFAWNLTGGCTISKAVLASAERRRDFWRWETASKLVRMAEAIGLEFEVPFGRWLGHGGATRFNEDQLDFLSTAAALAPITRQIMLFSTAHVTYGFHPIHFAKFGATIDQISGGRWGLNVVTGWIEDEQALFGQQFPDHERRYEMADEFVTLMKWAWSSEEPITFEGEFYRSYGAYVSPKPARKPRPLLVNAGTSPTGIDFAAKHCDWIFCLGGLEQMRRTADAVEERAEFYHRQVSPMTFAYVVMDETDERAQATFDWLVSEIDEEAADTFIKRGMAGSQSGTPIPGFTFDPMRPIRQQVGEQRYIGSALGLGGHQIVGTPEMVAEEIRRLYQQGRQRGVLLSFFDPEEGLALTRDRLLPILHKMGLRKSS